jgi:hypothetical protein
VSCDSCVAKFLERQLTCSSCVMWIMRSRISWEATNLQVTCGHHLIQTFDLDSWSFCQAPVTEAVARSHFMFPSPWAESGLATHCSQLKIHIGFALYPWPLVLAVLQMKPRLAVETRKLPQTAHGCVKRQKRADPSAACRACRACSYPLISAVCWVPPTYFLLVESFFWRIERRCSSP